MPPKRTMADSFGPRHGGMFASARAKDRRSVMSRLWKYLSRYRGGLVGISLVVAVTTGLSLCGPYLIGRAIDKYISHGNLHGLAYIVGLMISVCLLRAGGTWLQVASMVRIAQRTIQDIRRDLFGQMQTLSLRFFDQNSHGDLMSRLTNDTDTISSTLADSVTQLISSLLSIIGAGSMMLIMNWRLALVSFAILPLITLTTRAIAGRTRQEFRERQQAIGDLNGIVEECIAGQRVTKVCCHEEQAIQGFEVANADLKRTATRALIFVGMMGPAMNMFRNIGFAAIAGVGGWMVTKSWMTIGAVAAFINYSDYFNRPLLQIANLYGTIQSALAGAERVFAVMDETSEEIDAPGSICPESTRGEIDFDGVCFGYEESVPVLRDISFHVDAGQTIALIGSTGAGKTTIINLLTRFYDVDSGCIRIDGNDIRDIRKSALRKALGIVLQDTYLFTDTVRENIRYGRLGASDADVEAAAKLANADQFIQHLPHGYDTLLSDAGGGLSQGQRQLLAIARTILANPAVLILDEATSSVDTRTEAHIQEALQRLMQDRTSFIIAHRLNTIQRADRILVIENGRIAEQGSPAELLARQGVYYRLHGSLVGAVPGNTP